jgi:hypothetical protein
MKTKGHFTAACQALRTNDPSLTELNLAEYGPLLDRRRKRVQQVVEALEKNTSVEDITLSATLSVHRSERTSMINKSTILLMH